jgi:hypothetical protein
MIFFDIETGPLPLAELDALMPEFKPAANLKDPEKIKASVEEKRQAYYEQAALSPLTGKVIAIGLELDVGFGIMSEPVHSKESEILTEFWKLVRDNNNSQFIGFNIAHFDLPFLLRRSMKYGLKTPPVFDKYRHLTDQFIDLMHIWQCCIYGETISLDRLARFLGVGQKEGSGKDFAKLWYEDRPKAIEYLRNDLFLTKKCAERLIPDLPPEPKYESEMPS